MSREQTVQRYVPTYRLANGLRVLMRAAQGRFTFATEREAEDWIQAVISNNGPEHVAQAWGEDPRFRVICVPCWSTHLDPVNTVYGSEPGKAVPNG